MRCVPLVATLLIAACDASDGSPGVDGGGVALRSCTGATTRTISGTLETTAEGVFE